MANKNNFVAVPDSYTCSGCKQTFALENPLRSPFDEPLSAEETISLCEGTHPQYSLLCEDCMALYIQVAESEGLN